MLQERNLPSKSVSEPSPDSVRFSMTATSGKDVESVRKRLDNDEDEEGRKKIKTETSSDVVDLGDPEVEIVQVDQFQAAMSNKTASFAHCAPINDNDGGALIIGTKHHVDLPHMRQHCTECPFVTPTFQNTKQALPMNLQFCSHCYCYVCDDKAPVCPYWYAHCHAAERGLLASFWKMQRNRVKQEKKRMPRKVPPPSMNYHSNVTMESPCWNHTF